MLGGPLLWVDDAAFSITRHLHVARVSAPWGRGCDAGHDHRYPAVGARPLEAALGSLVHDRDRRAMLAGASGRSTRRLLRSASDRRGARRQANHPRRATRPGCGVYSSPSWPAACERCWSHGASPWRAWSSRRRSRRLCMVGAAGLVDARGDLDLFVTNVPGPPVPLYVLGARILDMLPIVVFGYRTAAPQGVDSWVMRREPRPIGPMPTMATESPGGTRPLRTPTS
jgi:hypothetical protein